jgi:hypothetical protein
MLATYLGIFLLSMAGLCLEITLTRIFSLAQWYHFAFMAVSIALLGFGASGSFLSLFPNLVKKNPTRLLAGLSMLLALGILASYLNINYIPFDSYRIAWEREQILFLAIYYLFLALPFFFSGLAIGVLLAAQPEQAGKIYSFNLAGSALGCLAAVVALPLLGGARTVMFSALLGALAAIAFALEGSPSPNPSLGGRGTQTPPPRRGRLGGGGFCQLLVSGLIALALLFLTVCPPSFLEIRLSPYKGLSQALLYPGAEVVFSRWNAFSRVDVIESQGVKSAPGLSLAHPDPLPPQLGLFTDGDNLSPITRPEKLGFIDYLPVSLPHRLRSGAKALIIEPKGGLDVLAALQQGASSVVAVESNPLVIQVARDTFEDPYLDQRVTVVAENGRSYVRRVGERFDVVQVSLADTYRPVTSGAYSLSENYLYTVEAFVDYLANLSEGGLLVVSRWLQMPPSESLRAGALAVTALEKAGFSQPELRLVAIRSWSTLLLLVKNGEFTGGEIEAVKSFCQQRQFDLVYYPGIQEAEANRYNVYPEPLYYQGFQDLLFGDRARFYAEYSYDVSPTTDDRPFFFHFFKWSQTPEILQTFGKIWQPFGGSGYFVLVALLILALLASAVLILFPLLFRRRASALLLPPDRQIRRPNRWRVFAYFAMLGFGYLFVEIPLMQHFILFLGQPVYAFAAVLFAILLFSGLGSMISARPSLPKTLMALIGAIILYPFILPFVFRLLLGQSLGLRLLVAVLSLAPLGFLMGVPFPKGVEIVGRLAPDLVPWAWGINGCTSVLASILSAMLAISFGFSWVLVVASVAYAAALGVIYPLAGLGTSGGDGSGPVSLALAVLESVCGLFPCVLLRLLKGVGLVQAEGEGAQLPDSEEKVVVASAKALSDVPPGQTVQNVDPLLEPQFYASLFKVNFGCKQLLKQRRILDAQSQFVHQPGNVPQLLHEGEERADLFIQVHVDQGANVLSDSCDLRGRGGQHSHQRFRVRGHGLVPPVEMHLLDRLVEAFDEHGLQLVHALLVVRLLGQIQLRHPVSADQSVDDEESINAPGVGWGDAAVEEIEGQFGGQTELAPQRLVDLPPLGEEEADQRPGDVAGDLGVEGAAVEVATGHGHTVSVNPLD